MIKKIFGLVITLFIFAGVAAAENPKREFRGAWIHVIGQNQWMNKSPQQQRDYIDQEFGRLYDAGCNAVIFQVRPTADALYKSEYEPWSSWLTGKRGKAPSEDWDPLAYAIESAHSLGMELHAWLNPYRVTSNPKEELPDNHLSKQHPERFVKFDGKVFFDPAYQENRDFICTIVNDIVTRYDVDAIHIDDYFYPYPASDGTKFNADDASYNKFGKGMNRGDWRRKNVDMLIEQLNRTIKNAKPWVRFGVSPFGIWRNKKNDPRGSDSNGLQNYDDLYADVLLWAKNGWIDYIAPQLYWQLDLKVAPSRHLAKWWDENCEGVDVYIGQDTKRTMDTPDSGTGSPNELGTKIKLSRDLKNIKGNVWWHGYWVADNYKGVRDKLASDYQSTFALPPVYGNPAARPEAVKGLKFINDGERVLLSWQKPAQGARMKDTDAVKYVVYEFLPGEDVNNLEKAETIIAVTPNNLLVLIEQDAISEIRGNTYVVTALDRMNRESKPVKVQM